MSSSSSPEVLWGAQPRPLLSCLHMEKGTLLGRGHSNTPSSKKSYPAGYKELGGTEELSTGPEK